MLCAFHPGRGGGVLPSNRLMGMCHWMGLHFHDWMDYNGVAFSTQLLEWGCIFSGFGSENSPASRDFGYFWVLKYRTICGTNMKVKYVFCIQFNHIFSSF